jgi:hypothetical protein
MYYWQALLLQYLIENAGDNGEFTISHMLVFELKSKDLAETNLFTNDL